MSAKFDQRAELIKIVAMLDDTALSQVISFAAGYEEAKSSPMTDVQSSTYSPRQSTPKAT